jgi:hypothetical protein
MLLPEDGHRIHSVKRGFYKKNWMMDNAQKVNYYINVPSSQTLDPSLQDNRRVPVFGA